MTFSGSSESSGEIPRVIFGIYDDTFDGTVESLEGWRAEGRRLPDEMAGATDGAEFGVPLEAQVPSLEADGDLFFREPVVAERHGDWAVYDPKKQPVDVGCVEELVETYRDTTAPLTQSEQQVLDGLEGES